MIGSNQRFGALGEKLAARYLKEQGYKILKKNYKNKLGEIDIIAVDKNEIVFVEVKTRSARPYLGGLQPRFDIIEVEVERGSGQMKKINHIKNAFSQTENYARF